MTTLTIPRNITKGEELIIIPRKEYERLFISPKKKLDPGLEQALEDVKVGRLSGPFTSVKKLIKSLENK